MDQLSFAIPEVYQGFAAVGGVAIITAEGLRLEYETRDRVVGFIRSGVKQVLVPWDELMAVEFQKGIWGAKLRLRTASMNSLGDIPGREGNELLLKFGRDRRQEVEAFAQRLQLRAADQSIEQVLEKLRQMGV
jgi:hypothetical protein